jgi:hypothetical protein
MIRKLSYLAAALMGIGLLATPSAYAATSYTWTFTSCANAGTYTMGNACTDSTSDPAGGPSLTATAYSNTGGGAINNANDTIQTAHAELYGGGIGISNAQYNGNDTGETLSTAPEHAIDNVDYTDSLLLSFSGLATPVTLNSITSGWTGTDADFDLLAYVGGCPTCGSTPSTLVGNTYAALLNQGWAYVGQYSTFAHNLSSGTTTATVNGGTTPVTSSYWLVLADTTLPGHTSLGSSDYFKVLSVAATYTPSSGGGHQNPAPEPGSLALLGVGSLLLLRIRAKSSKS